MSLFQSAESTTAFLKMGIMGKQGAGKSYTAAKVAVGLVNLLKEKQIDYANKPVAFFDTETGSDWLIPMFKTAGIPLVVAKKKSFADLLAATKWAEQNASLFIIDSITHPWRELLESYMKTKQRSFLQIDDWGYLKGSHGWQQFTDLYVNTKLHIIMCGRAGDDTEQYTDENGKRPVYGGVEKFQSDPHWRDLILFYEYFHGDSGAGLGASHQTGWTGLVASLIDEWRQ